MKLSKAIRTTLEDWLHRDPGSSRLWWAFATLLLAPIVPIVAFDRARFNEPERAKLKNIIVNARPRTTPQDTMMYEAIAALAGLRGTPTVVVSYRRCTDCHEHDRSPIPGERVPIHEGMIISVADTSRA
jgi:hypothetical protein